MESKTVKLSTGRECVLTRVNALATFRLFGSIPDLLSTPERLEQVRADPGHVDALQQVELSLKLVQVGCSSPRWWLPPEGDVHAKPPDGMTSLDELSLAELTELLELVMQHCGLEDLKELASHPLAAAPRP